MTPLASCWLRIDAEQVDLAAHKVTDPWLIDSEEFCCRALRQFARLDQVPKLNHQLRAELQALGLLRAKAEVSEHVPDWIAEPSSHWKDIMLLVESTVIAGAVLGVWGVVIERQRVR